MMRNLFIVFLITAAWLPASPSDEALPLFFIENQGQVPAEVRFMAQGSGLTAFFSRSEAVFRVAGAVVRVRFGGARDSVDVEGTQALPGRANFLTGDPELWRAGVPVYGGVLYRQLY